MGEGTTADRVESEVTRVLAIVGARPQFVKAAPVTHEAARRGLKHFLLHTGQHFDSEMSAVFFDELGIPPPDVDLGIAGGGHGVMTGRMLAAIEPVLIDVAPSAVVVYGDTNSTLAGALAAAKLKLPVAHVEAGLRSYNRCMPEELNRVVADHVSNLLFCPTTTAVDNLALEGVIDGVHYVGDVMYDAALIAAAKAELSTVVERLALAGTSYALATVHRAENTDAPGALARVLEFLRSQAETQPVVLPVHPRTRAAAERAGLDFDGMLVTPPLGYLDFTRLLKGAAVVFTDSGGLQKEAYFHRVPCVTMRDQTEWVETVECGWNRLWTVPDYRPRREIPDYGDGHAAARILDEIVAFLR